MDASSRLGLTLLLALAGQIPLSSQATTQASGIRTPPAPLLAWLKKHDYQLEPGPGQAVSGRFRGTAAEDWALLVRKGPLSCILVFNAGQPARATSLFPEPRKRFLVEDGRLIRRLSVPEASRRQGALDQIAWQHPEAKRLLAAATNREILEEQISAYSARYHIWTGGGWRSFEVAD